MDINDLGRDPSGQAFVASPSSPAVSTEGFNPSRGFRLLGYATGSYMGRCGTCGAEFIGDKRSRICIACAAEEADHIILLQRQMIAELKARLAISEDGVREILWRHLGGDERASIPNEPPEGVMPGLWADLLNIANGERVDAVMISPLQARMILASIVKAKVRDATEEVLGGEEE